jgi:FkbM family methyltransferase
MKSYSQYSQDVVILNMFFRNPANGIEDSSYKRGGFFVDVGAHDGVSFSNTALMERELGWRGLCFEPLPERFMELQKNRTAKCFQACAYNSAGTVTFSAIKGAPEMLSGITASYDPRHVARIDREVRENGGTVENITVATVKLSDIFAQEGITHVDFLSVDTEGSELQVLEGIDFDAVTIDILTVEENYPDQHQISPVTKFMLSKGYRPHTILVGDIVYVRNGFGVNTL